MFAFLFIYFIYISKDSFLIIAQLFF